MSIYNQYIPFDRWNSILGHHVASHWC